VTALRQPKNSIMSKMPREATCRFRRLPTIILLQLDAKTPLELTKIMSLILMLSKKRTSRNRKTLIRFMLMMRPQNNFNRLGRFSSGPNKKKSAESAKKCSKKPASTHPR
jgi:hypothetical protein